MGEADYKTVKLTLTTILVIGVLSLVIAAVRGLIPEEDEKVMAFQAVQETYLEGKFGKNCEEVSAAMSRLNSYFNNVEPLPTEIASTVTLPRHVVHSTVGDLAVDRSLKLQPLKEALCK